MRTLVTPRVSRDGSRGGSHRRADIRDPRRANRATGLTILLIEHVMRAVMALASRVLVLHHGATIAEGMPSAVVREPAVIHSYLGAEAL